MKTGADRSLSSPQRTLEVIRECYPYFAHGRSKKGEVVVYEQTGKMRFGRLAEAGVSPFDMQVCPVPVPVVFFVLFFMNRRPKTCVTSKGGSFRFKSGGVGAARGRAGDGG